MRELQGLGEVLREREGELEAYADRLEKAVSDAKSERARQEFYVFGPATVYVSFNGYRAFRANGRSGSCSIAVE